MPDVNVLVYAHREESPGHLRYLTWMTEVANGMAPFAVSEPVLHGFLRVVTNPRIFSPPSTMEAGLVLWMRWFLCHIATCFVPGQITGGFSEVCARREHFGGSLWQMQLMPLWRLRAGASG